MTPLDEWLAVDQQRHVTIGRVHTQLGMRWRVSLITYQTWPRRMVDGYGDSRAEAEAAALLAWEQEQ